MVANEFQRTSHQPASVLPEKSLPLWVGMADDLIRIGGAAIHHRAISVGLELRAGRVLRRAQRSEELALIPRTEQDVFAPLGIRVFHPVFGELRPLLDGRRAGHVTEPARVRTADRDVERPIREALVNKVVRRNDRGRGPHADAVVGLGPRRPSECPASLSWFFNDETHGCTAESLIRLGAKVEFRMHDALA